MPDSYWVNDTGEYLVDENGKYFFDDHCCCDFEAACCPGAPDGIWFTLSSASSLCGDCSPHNGFQQIGPGFSASHCPVTPSNFHKGIPPCKYSGAQGRGCPGTVDSVSRICLALACNELDGWEVELSIKIISLSDGSFVHTIVWYKEGGGLFNFPIVFVSGDIIFENKADPHPCTVPSGQTLQLVLG